MLTGRRLEAVGSSIRIQPEITSRAGDGPIKYICPTTSKQHGECDIILIDMPHVSTDTSMLTGRRLEAVGSSIRIQPEITSRVSDGPIKYICPITSKQHGECDDIL
jgi:hypothetical protein